MNFVIKSNRVPMGRDYTTVSSAHGLPLQPTNPTEFNMTKAEAEADVKFWEVYADTVGGYAEIVKRPQSLSK